MEAVADATPDLAGTAARRANAALAARRAAEPIDLIAARAQFARLMQGAVGAEASV